MQANFWWPITRDSERLLSADAARLISRGEQDGKWKMKELGWRRKRQMEMRRDYLNRKDSISVSLFSSPIEKLTKKKNFPKTKERMNYLQVWHRERTSCARIQKLTENTAGCQVGFNLFSLSVYLPGLISKTWLAIHVAHCVFGSRWIDFTSMRGNNKMYFENKNSEEST